MAAPLAILRLSVLREKKMTDKLKDKIEKFLTMCLKSKSEKESGNPIKVDELTEEQHKEIAVDAVAITNSLVELQRLLPLSRQLAELGHLFEAQGKISVKAGEAYDEAALSFLTELYGAGLPLPTRLH